MQSCTFKSLCGFVGLVAMAGCTGQAEETGAAAAEVPYVQTRQTDPLLFNFQAGGAVQNANALLDTQSDLHDALNEFGVPRGQRSDLQWIERIRGQAGGMPSGVLDGVGGIVGRAFLEGARQTTRVPGSLPSNWEQAIEIAAYGEIVDYFYENDPSSPDFGSGRLEVITYYDLTSGPTGRPPRTVAYKWIVRVDPGGFSVVPKKDPGDEGYQQHNVFPGTIPIPESKVAPLGLNRKLWAKGMAIEVVDIVRDLNVGTNGPNWQPMPPANPEFAPLYARTDSACIDMMFNGEPPRELPAGASPPLYCLGRCDQPLIINTK